MLLRCGGSRFGSGEGGPRPVRLRTDGQGPMRSARRGCSVGTARRARAPGRAGWVMSQIVVSEVSLSCLIWDRKEVLGQVF